MLNLQKVVARDLPDLWFQAIRKVLDEGEEHIIDEGSYAGQTRLEFDYFTGHVRFPGTQPLLPDIPPHIGLPNPVEEAYIYGGEGYERSYIEYLMSPTKQIGESYCYDKKTEVLTDDGWKFFNDLNGNEKIATLNPETNELIYQDIVNVHKMIYNGEMFHFNNNQIDCMVTPNHKMFVTEKRNDNFSLRKANTLLGHSYKFKKDCVWNGKEKKYFILDEVEYNNERYSGFSKKRKIDMDLWLKFFGVWLADGSLRKQKNSYAIVVSKRKEEQRKIILPIMEEIFGNVIIYDKDLIVDDKQIHSYLRQFGLAEDKFIPKDILNLSSRQLKILFNYMYMCDGNTTKDGITKSRYSSKSIKLINNIQEICLKIGLSGNVRSDRGIYRLNINNSKKGSIASTTPCITMNLNFSKYNDYNDMVYCVEVKDYHIIYVRRNGTPCWSGNTYGERLTKEPISIIQEMDIDIDKNHNIYQNLTQDRKIVFKEWDTRFINQIEWIIAKYQTGKHWNNQLVLQIAKPSDIILLDPPCLRSIDTRIKNGKLHFFVYFRSWDLWGGLPANLAGIQNLKEYMASAIGVEDGEMIVESKGLHLYGYAKDLVKMRCMVE